MSTKDFLHVPVLLKKSLEFLKIKSDGIYVDGTLGGGGHAFEICKLLDKNGHLVAIDCDHEAIEAAKIKLTGCRAKLDIIHDNYKNIRDILNDVGVKKIDGAMLDLGVSSYQLDAQSRGFSYKCDAKLDMRMDVDSSFSALTLVNSYSEKKLTEVIFKYGEERYARSIAKNIVAQRRCKPIDTTFELVEVIKKSIPAIYKFKGKHPAKRTFQAIRIEVNGELAYLEPAIRDFAKFLNSGGVLLVISFHSLEDRIVKNIFADLSKGCICPSEFPICVCKRKIEYKILTKKPVMPDEDEISKNNRARSAKLRAICKI